MLKLFTRCLPYILCVSALGGAPAALAATPVTVTILRFIQGQDPDPVQVVDAINKPDTIGHGDYYAEVRIGSNPFERNRSDFIESTDFQPFWRFSRTIDDDGIIPVVIRIWDADPFENNDDIIDINENDSVQELVLNLDLGDCTWTGDVGPNGMRSRGDGDKNHTGDLEGGERGTVLYDIACSATGDIDNDGIPDGVERFGLQNEAGNLVTDMRSLGADPCQRTIAVEIDAMLGNSPHPDALQILRDAFSKAPLNPINNCPYSDFLPAKPGIGLVIDLSDQDIPQEDKNSIDDVPNFKRDFAERINDRYFHYSLWVDAYADNVFGGFCCRGDRGTDFIVVEGDVASNQRRQAVRFMHELGHALGLGHSGGSRIDRDKDGNQVSRNCKPNYLSIMNYSFATGLMDTATGNIVTDYSRSTLPTLDEARLSENNGISDGTLQTCWSPFLGVRRCGTGNGPLNWNGNMVGSGDVIDPNTVSSDINQLHILSCRFSWTDDDENGKIDSPGEIKIFDTPGDILKGFNDWENLQYRGPLAATASGLARDVVELTNNEIAKIEDALQASLRCFPPDSGNWIISQNCTIWRDVTAPGDLSVVNGAVLKIGSGITLDVDFITHSLLVEPGARIEVQPGGRIE